MKNLLERVSEYTQSRSSSRDATKIFIIANRVEIQKTLDHGYDIKTIWETLKKEGRIQSSYSGFCQKLKKHLQPQASSLSIKSPVTPKSAGKAIPPKTYHVSKSEGFTFNPTPNKEDLY